MIKQHGIIVISIAIYKLSDIIPTILLRHFRIYNRFFGLSHFSD